jgi:hypothetical protein
MAKIWLLILKQRQYSSFKILNVVGLAGRQNNFIFI